jgi:hypothetical protein
MRQCRGVALCIPERLEGRHLHIVGTLGIEVASAAVADMRREEMLIMGVVTSWRLKRASDWCELSCLPWKTTIGAICVRFRPLLADQRMYRQSARNSDIDQGFALDRGARQLVSAATP